MNVTQTYRPGDIFLEFVTVPADTVVIATVWRNGSVTSGITVSSPVVDGQCQISFDIPADWSTGDVIVVQLRGTSEEEDLDEPETFKFQLESQRLSAVASQASVDALPSVAEIQSGLGTLAKQEEILIAIDNIESGSVPEETVEQVAEIYSHFNHLEPGQPGIVLPAPTNPQMVKIAVFLVGGPAPRNGEEVTVTMYEKGNVYIDGWYQIKREFTGTSGTYADKNNVVFEGVAVIDVYDSQKLEDNECNGLYQVVAKGLQRDLWVLPGGGDIGPMPTAKPEETE